MNVLFHKFSYLQPQQQLVVQFIMATIKHYIVVKNLSCYLQVIMQITTTHNVQPYG